MRTFYRLNLSLVLLFGVAPLCRGDDATNTFPLLECKSQTFTNARVSTVTDAYAVIIYDGGGKKVPLADLPPFLQERYHYDPDKAAKFLAVQKQKKEAAAEATAQQLAAEEPTRGERKKVKVLKVLGTYIGDTRCQIEAEGSQQEVLMSGGDFSPIQQYYAQLDALENDATATRQASAQISAQATYRNRRAAAIKSAEQQNANAGVKTVAEELKALKAQGTNVITIYAAATNRKYANLPIWVYLGKNAQP